MNEENEVTAEAAVEAEPVGPVCGERLQEARRELQISILEISKELHLDEYKVRALESNDFEVLGAPVFAKGHLKKYAQLVQVDEADVMADYYQLERAHGTPSLVPEHRVPRRSVSLGPWIAGIIVIATAASAYWWFTTQYAPPEVAATPVTTPDAVREEAGEPAAGPGDDAELTTPTTPVATGLGDAAADESEAAISAAQPEADLTPNLPAELGTEQVTLSISYSGDSWTEITDATGSRLFFALGREGRSVDVRGEAPIDVLFGAADNVSLSVDGEVYTISAGDRRGQTARFTIDGS